MRNLTPATTSGRVDACQAYLAQQGLNLFAIFAADSLPAEIIQPLTDELGRSPAASSLLMLGHGGRDLWASMAESAWEAPDPIDTYSTHHTRLAVVDMLDVSTFQLLYPGPTRIPLQRLGALAGWSSPSPLGLGIHPEHGLWWAYRVLIWLEAPFPSTPPFTGETPCGRCITKPCIRACPARAVTLEAGFDVNRCTAHRVSPGSSCAETCLSRLACPVAPQSRYSMAQIQTHYRASLATIRSAAHGE